MKIYIAADHRGYELKEELKKHLAGGGYEVADCGNEKYDPEDDYPDFVNNLRGQMKADRQISRGIVICGSGIGVSIAANRDGQLRCGLCFNEEQARSARAHDNINVLALASDHTSTEAAKKIADIFLKTPFDDSPKYARRLEKIDRHA